MAGTRLFIGRQAELRRLAAALTTAARGEGKLALIMGEPGIGKTALCARFAALAARRGARVLTGHCYEEASLSLPYLPFVEALRAYFLAGDQDALAQDQTVGIAQVARLLPDLRARPDSQTEQVASPAADPEEARYQLLEGIVAFLRAASVTQPLVLVLEDLHDADRGSLDLLIHLARNLGGARLLVIGTYRDVEVDDTHPLAGALAQVRRAGPVERLPLYGLGLDDVVRMAAGVTRRPATHNLAELVYQQTEGNPLFVQEVLRELIAREQWQNRTGRASAAPIPEGLREVIGRRLSRLTAPCRRLLTVAAVAGREFRLDVETSPRVPGRQWSMEGGSRYAGRGGGGVTAR